MAAKSAVGTAVAAKSVNAAGLAEGVKGLAPSMKVAALQTAGTGTAKLGTATMTATKTTVASSAAKGITTGGTIWSGTGFSLGLGLGLGAAGPLLLGALVAAAGYGVYKYRSNLTIVSNDEDELTEALS